MYNSWSTPKGMYSNIRATHRDFDRLRFKRFSPSPEAQPKIHIKYINKSGMAKGGIPETS